MAKPGQKIVKGMLPQFANIGNKKLEKGVCPRCARKVGKLNKVDIGNSQHIRLCDDCVRSRDSIQSEIGSSLRTIDEAAMERFRRGK